MKITYAVPRYLPHLGGIENHVAALATRAAAAGHDVTVLTQHEGGVRLKDEEVLDGVTVQRLPSVLAMRGQGLSPALWWAVRHADQTTDILHVHNVHAASTLGVLAAAKRGRTVVTPHYLGTGEGRLNHALHRAYDPVLARALQRATALICVSGAEADELRRDLNVRAIPIRVIPNGVDVEFVCRTEPAPDAARAVFVAGRLEEYKQVALVVAAVALLEPVYSLVIAGAGPQAEPLRRLAGSSGAAERVHFVGKLDATAMASSYRRAAVVVSMSRRECFGMTLAEGLASGCAVVASDIPAHREVIEQAAWDTAALISPDAGPAEVALAIAAAGASLPSARPPVTSWDEVAASTLELYRTIYARAEVFES